MSGLIARLGEATRAAFLEEGLSADLAAVEPSNRPEMADFQCNGALKAGRARTGPPRALAEALAARLAGNPDLASVEAAGPGFLNLRVSSATLSKRAEELRRDPRSGAPLLTHPQRVVVDYGGPNVAKEMHVGHLRASIIGEAIKRVRRFMGDTVWGDAHFGDWGFQMGLLIIATCDASPAIAAAVEAVGQGAEAPAGAFAEADLAALERLYPAAAERARTDPAFRDRARRATAELQSGRAGYLALWRHFAQLTRGALERDFHALGIDFDLWKGESDVDPLIEPMIEDLAAKGLLVDDQGARIVRVERPGEKRSPPPLLVVSSEGSAMYGTTDLATILDRRRSLDPDRMLYVVDERQADHFETVFRAAYLAGYAAEGSLEHVGFGTMNGPDGRPFKTRAGGVLKLGDLIEMITGKARERLVEAGLAADMAPADFSALAHKVAVATLKLADLINYRGTSYVFDLDRFSSFEGKTGPYLLYQAVQVKSLMRKAAEAGLAEGPIAIEAQAERDLVLILDAFAAAAQEAFDRSAPNVLAEHAWRLASAFSRFYAACPILTAEPPVAASRLALAAATLAQLELTIGLLGIETPERM